MLIGSGQRFRCNNVDILNLYFGAINANGQPLGQFTFAAWPRRAPFLVNRQAPNQGNAVVWFPLVPGHGDWRNTLSGDRLNIKTEYVGERAFDEIAEKGAIFIGKLNIVFAHFNGSDEREFLGIYTSRRQGKSFVYDKIADVIETDDWRRQ